MAFGVPVVGRDRGALLETVGDAGLVLPSDAGPVLAAEALALVTGDHAVHGALAARARRRAGAFEPGALAERFVAAVRDAAHAGGR
jgi:glycosyltransferase involved in cell wall biosynthesis